jgi:hypothetical protein
MTLTRTKSGLQNLHILKRVELIVYTEGGGSKTLTKEEVLEGGGHDKSDDIRFWSEMFSQLNSNLSVKLLAVGSCETLKQIASEITSGNLNNVCVVMDRDYSNFWDSVIMHNRVIYTRTYSWENELFQTDVILKAFENLALETFDPVATKELIDETRNSILRQIKHFMKADLVLVAANHSLFDRKSPASCFKHTKKSNRPPEIDQNRLRKLLKSKKSDIRGTRLIHRHNLSSIDVARDVYGKPLLVASVRILQYLLHEAGQKPIPNDYLEKFLLTAFFDWLQENPTSDIAMHYKHQLTQIDIAA